MYLYARTLNLLHIMNKEKIQQWLYIYIYIYINGRGRTRRLQLDITPSGMQWGYNWISQIVVWGGRGGTGNSAGEEFFCRVVGTSIKIKISMNCVQSVWIIVQEQWLVLVQEQWLQTKLLSSGGIDLWWEEESTGGSLLCRGRRWGLSKLLAGRGAPPSRENPDKKILSPLKIASMY